MTAEQLLEFLEQHIARTAPPDGRGGVAGVPSRAARQRATDSRYHGSVKRMARELYPMYGVGTPPTKIWYNQP
jgi:hypothetical protein